METTMRHHLTVVINRENNKCWWGCREIEVVMDCWWKVNGGVYSYCKKVWQLFKIEFIYIILHFHCKYICPQKDGNQRSTSRYFCTVFNNSLFTIIKKLKESKHPWTDEEINKCSVLSTVGLLFSLKKN